MSKPNLVNIATRAFNTPLMIASEKAAVIAEKFGPMILGSASDVDLGGQVGEVTADHWQTRPQAGSMIGDEVHRHVKKRGGGYSNIQGVAVIPVTGTLVRRGSFLGESSGMTSYEGISAQVRAAAEDETVSVIALEIDSFGGEAAGIFDLAADIRRAREAKPVYAFIADYALSAGYAIASQADHITVPPFGQAGSIGVVSMHVDYEQQLKQEGVKVTLIHSGAHKVDGNPFEKLPGEVLSQIQKENDEMWMAFAQLVESGRRGKVKAEAALKMEAGVFRGRAAVEAGLVDEVAEARTAFAGLLQKLSAAVPPAGVLASGGMVSPAALHAALNAGAILKPAASGKTLSQYFPNQLTGPLTVAGPNLSSPGCQTGALAPQLKETGMKKDDVKTPAAEKPKATPAEAGSSAQPKEASTASADVKTPDGGAEARAYASKIIDKASAAGLPASFASKLIADNTPLADAYEKILDAKAARAQDGGDIRNTGGSRVAIIGDARDRTRAGLTAALLSRVRLDGGEQNEFTGMSLREMARVMLVAQGAQVPAGGVMALASASFSPSMAGASHTTSDFGNILANIANKAMLKGFDESVEIFEQFTSVGTMTDFKATKRVGLDAFPSLLKVREGAEFKYGTVGDYGETALLATYGRLFAITRQTIINDDLDAFSKIPMGMGRAARRTVGDLVFAVLSANAAMADGTALFHADHGNLAASGAIPSEVTINAGITAMSTQADNSGNANLNITPKFLLSPPKHRSSVLQSLNSEYAPDDTAKAGTTKQPRAYNTVKDAADPLFDARITGDEWYLLGDPSQYDTIEVGYLDGISTPFLDQQDGWSVDGTEFKVRIDATATALAHQAMYKNAGS